MMDVKWILVLGTVILLFRNWILGFIVSKVASLVSRKKVSIRKISLRPICFDGIHCQLKTAEYLTLDQLLLDVSLSNFFSSDLSKKMIRIRIRQLKHCKGHGAGSDGPEVGVLKALLTYCRLLDISIDKLEHTTTGENGTLSVSAEQVTAQCLETINVDLSKMQVNRINPEGSTILHCTLPQTQLNVAVSPTVPHIPDMKISGKSAEPVVIDTESCSKLIQLWKNNLTKPLRQVNSKLSDFVPTRISCSDIWLKCLVRENGHPDLIFSTNLRDQAIIVEPSLQKISVKTEYIKLEAPKASRADAGTLDRLCVRQEVLEDGSTRQCIVEIGAFYLRLAPSLQFYLTSVHQMIQFQKEHELATGIKKRKNQVEWKIKQGVIDVFQANTIDPFLTVKGHQVNVTQTNRDLEGKIGSIEAKTDTDATVMLNLSGIKLDQDKSSKTWSLSSQFVRLNSHYEESQVVQCEAIDFKTVIGSKLIAINSKKIQAEWTMEEHDQIILGAKTLGHDLRVAAIACGVIRQRLNSETDETSPKELRIDFTTAEVRVHTTNVAMVRIVGEAFKHHQTIKGSILTSQSNIEHASLYAISDSHGEKQIGSFRGTQVARHCERSLENGISLSSKSDIDFQDVDISLHYNVRTLLILHRCHQYLDRILKPKIPRNFAFPDGCDAFGIQIRRISLTAVANPLYESQRLLQLVLQAIKAKVSLPKPTASRRKAMSSKIKEIDESWKDEFEVVLSEQKSIEIQVMSESLDLTCINTSDNDLSPLCTSKSLELTSKLILTKFTEAGTTHPQLKQKLFGDIVLTCPFLKSELIPDQVADLTKAFDALKFTFEKEITEAERAEKLAWWDAARYTYHGKACIRCPDVQLRAHSMYHEDVVQTSCRDVEIIHGNSESDLRVQSLQVDILRSDPDGDDASRYNLLPFLYLPRISLTLTWQWTFSQKHHYLFAYESQQDTVNSFLATAVRLQARLQIGKYDSLECPENNGFGKATIPVAGQAYIGIRWDVIFQILARFIEHFEEIPILRPSDPIDRPKLGALIEAFEFQLHTSWMQFLLWDGSIRHDSIVVTANEIHISGIVELSPLKCPALQFGLDGLRGYLLQVRRTKRRASPEKRKKYKSILRSVYFPFDETSTHNFFFEASTVQYSHGFSNPRLPLLALNDLGRDKTIYESIFGSSPSLEQEDAAILQFTKNHENFRPCDPTIPMYPVVQTNDTEPSNIRIQRLQEYLSRIDDGSDRDPVSVQSMKLLWTIQTRDEVFYIARVIAEDVFVIKDKILEITEKVEPVPQVSPSVNAKLFISTSSRNSPTTKAKASLLDMLHAGKLGRELSSPRNMSPRNSKTFFPNSPRASRHNSISGSQDDQTTSEGKKTMKEDWVKHIFSISGVQINVRDDVTKSSLIIASEKVQLTWSQLSDYGTTATSVEIEFNSVSSHVAPTDVDIEAGIQWLELSLDNNTNDAPVFSSGSGLLKQVLRNGEIRCSYDSFEIAEGYQSPSENFESEDKFSIEIPDLNLTLDRDQFYQVLGVVRHVLLAPPAKIQRRKKSCAFNITSPEHDVGLLATPRPMETSNEPVSQPTKQKLLSLTEAAIRNTTDPQHTKRHVVKVIEFKFGTGSLRLHVSPEMTTVGMSGYDFVEVAVRGIEGQFVFYSNESTNVTAQLQWIEINNLRPGPSSIEFDDAMAVLKPQLVCRDSSTKKKHSSISSADQKGMLNIRAETGKPVQVLGRKVTVYDVLEFSIFPGISYSIVIQLAADLYELMYLYFFLSDETDVASEELLFGAQHCKAKEINPARKKISLRLGKRMKDALSTAASLEDDSGDESETDETSIDATQQELSYFKYIRIGKLCLRINCNGFVVKLRKFDLDLTPFVRRGKLWTWKKFLKKFEKHLKWYVTKETASSGFSMVRSKIMKSKQKDNASATNEELLFGAFHIETD